jgi:DNA polymerase elongation subunit (family B)
MSKPRILTLDIETSPNMSYTWGMWQQNVATNQLIQPTEMLTVAAKFLGERSVWYGEMRYDDKPLNTLHNLMEEADMIVGYNSDKFDLRHINREFAQANLSPVRPVPTVDLLKVVKKNFLFPHNRLDYVAGVLLDERKLETGGFDLWTGYMSGDNRARRLMKKYNVQDVRLTEKLYLRLRPYVSNHPYLSGTEVDFGDEPVYTCPSCGGNHIADQRQRRTRCFAIRQNRCASCGHWFDGKRKKLT